MNKNIWRRLTLTKQEITEKQNNEYKDVLRKKKCEKGVEKYE